jgi:hypothetical protein
MTSCNLVLLLFWLKWSSKTPGYNIDAESDIVCTFFMLAHNLIDEMPKTEILNMYFYVVSHSYKALCSM